jgi:hypothetical protein
MLLTVDLYGNIIIITEAFRREVKSITLDTQVVLVSSGLYTLVVLVRNQTIAACTAGTPFKVNIPVIHTLMLSMQCWKQPQ